MNMYLQQYNLNSTVKYFGDVNNAMLDLKKIETCGLIKGLDFIYRIMLYLSVLLLLL